MKTLGPSTLVEALHDLRGESRRGFTFLDRKLQPEVWSFAQVVAEAERRGSELRRLGVEPGDRLALILPEGRDFVLTFLGAVLAGIVPVPMYPPVSLARAAAYLETTRGVLQSCGARHLVTSEEARPMASQLLGVGSSLQQIFSTEQLAGAGPADLGLLARPEPESVCFLQYTSGSTARPKGVVVTHGNIVANGLAIMRDGLASDPERDLGLSWLPLYHDMGLVGFVLAPLLVGVPVVFVPTLAFVKQPSTWLRLVSEYRATITFGPNFAYGLCVKRAKHDGALDLSCLRVLGCGAEPIHADTMREFVARYVPHGLKPDALIPCYGMAEATLAISFERLDEPLHSARIERAAYVEQGRVKTVSARDLAPSLEIVSCGRPFPGHALRIVNAAGDVLPEGCVGEIQFRGPSASGGYFGDADATRELFQSGWLQTGDLGFLLGGRLHVSGRKKDLLILNGRNHYPQSIEWATEQVEGVRAGSAVAFASTWEGAEHPIVVAECTPSASVPSLRRDIQRRVSEILGIAIARVVIVKQSSVPRTTSGKLQRNKTRELFEAGALQSLDEANAAPHA